MIVKRYGVLPKELWDLNSISDMGAGRGVTYKSELSQAIFKSILRNNRYVIINLTIRGSNYSFEFPVPLKQLKLMASEYRYPLDLPENLEELTLGWGCMSIQQLMFPEKLRKLCYYLDRPTPFPLGLVELDLGSYSGPLSLPPSLQL